MDGSFPAQLKQHLAALKAAGIDYLPRPLSTPAVVEAPRLDLEPPAPSPVVVSDNSGLFDGNTASVPDTPEGRRHELKLLAEKIAPCSRCSELFSTRTQTVFGVGKVEPDICFVGEAPGADEDARGEPFVGRAGRLLTDIITKGLGYRREDVYICNILKCRPPDNRNPEPDEVLACNPFLKRQLAAIKPKIVCCLGKFAAQNVLQSAAPISRLRGEFHDIDGMRVIATFHPAYLLRSPDKKREAWEDLKKVRAFLHGEISE